MSTCSRCYDNGYVNVTKSGFTDYGTYINETDRVCCTHCELGCVYMMAERTGKSPWTCAREWREDRGLDKKID